MADARRLLVPAFGAYLALFAVLLHTSGRHVPIWLYATSSVLFAGLVLLLRRASRPASWPASRVALVVIAGAALLQIVALTAGPTTSDDVYRYIWDGRVQFAGIDPYAYPPQSPHLAHLRDGSLFLPPRAHCVWPIPDGCSLINRPSVRTIYPPVAQLLFDFAHLVSFGGHGGVHTFQVLAALGVVAVAALLARSAVRRGGAIWPVALWAWSPVAVIEYGNNAHIDWAAVLLGLLCLAAAARRGRRGRTAWAGVLLAAATLTKLYPALLGPALLRRRPLVLLSSAAAVVVLAYVPHVLAAGTDVIGYLPGYLHEEGYNSGSRLLLLGAVLPHPVDTVVGVVIMAAVAVWCWRRADPDAPETAAVVLVGTAFLVTTPGFGWYAGLLLALAVVSRRYEWVPVAFAPTLVYLVRADISHASWYGSTIYLVAALATLLLGIARSRPMGRSWVMPAMAITRVRPAWRARRSTRRRGAPGS